MTQAAPPTLRRLQIDLPAHEEQGAGSQQQQSPVLRLEVYDDDHPTYLQQDQSTRQLIYSAQGLVDAVSDYAAVRRVAVALEDDGRGVVFDRA